MFPALSPRMIAPLFDTLPKVLPLAEVLVVSRMAALPQSELSLNRERVRRLHGRTRDGRGDGQVIDRPAREDRGIDGASGTRPRDCPGSLGRVRIRRDRCGADILRSLCDDRAVVRDVAVLELVAVEVELPVAVDREGFPGEIQVAREGDLSSADRACGLRRVPGDGHGTGTGIDVALVRDMESIGDDVGPEAVCVGVEPRDIVAGFRGIDGNVGDVGGN